MTPNSIFTKKLLILTGKGGTGKTTLCSALGLIASRIGKKTLLVEVNAREDIPALFGEKKHGYTERELITNLYSMSIDPFKAMEEYLYLRLKVRMIVKRIMNSALYKYLAKATPGLRELATIGKVWHLCERAVLKDGRPRYDLVILDAPSTGHGIPMLKLPETAIEAIKVGPVVSEARKVQTFLSDRQMCGLNLVSISEEMPVSETTEFYQKAKEELDIGIDCLFINMVLPQAQGINIKNSSGVIQNIKGVLDYFRMRRNSQEHYIEKLKTEIKRLKTIEVPWIPSTRIGGKELFEIADAIKEQLQ